MVPHPPGGLPMGLETLLPRGAVGGGSAKVVHGVQALLEDSEAGRAEAIEWEDYWEGTWN